MNEKTANINELTSLVKISIDELKTMNIENIVEKFKPILDEFIALTETIRPVYPKYNEIFKNFIHKISSLYNIRVNVMLVRVYNYSTDKWGPVYWNFFHLSSILLEYAFYENKINHIFDFTTLIYNIDCILPCSICATHYQAIKSRPDVISAMKDISFGYIMSGLQRFHNIVTENISKTLEYRNFPKRPDFSLIDFAGTYNCIEISQSSVLKSKDYQRNKVDWQPKIHRMLTTLLALSSKESYIKSSERIKLILYGDKKSEKNNEISTLNKKQIFDLMINTILLKVDPKVATGNGKIYNDVIYAFYSMYPDIVKKLVNNLSEKLNYDNSNVESSNDYNNDIESHKIKILKTLERITDGSYNEET